MRATARILVRDGYDDTSTNRVAELAGVSVGSLYQYFPGKEALVAELIDRHQAAVMAALSPDPAILTQPLEQVARTLVEAMMRAHAVDPKLHKVLLEVAPRLGKQAFPVRDLGVQVVKGILQLHRARLRPLDDDLAAFIIVHACEALCHETMLSRHDLLKEPKFVAEVAELLVRYVRK